jgi:hypothetical protein
VIEHLSGVDAFLVVGDRFLKRGMKLGGVHSLSASARCSAITGRLDQGGRSSAHGDAVELIELRDVRSGDLASFLGRHPPWFRRRL